MLITSFKPAEYDKHRTERREAYGKRMESDVCSSARGNEIPEFYSISENYKEITKIMADFDEKSGTVHCSTSWGSWFQTVDVIYVEINCKDPINSKQIRCQIKPQFLECSVNGERIVEGTLFDVVRPDDSTWTLEDKRTIRILLTKVHPDAGNCWKSLLRQSSNSDGQIYEVDSYVFDQMQRKLTLERFQKEQPGFDFSNAEITGNYHDGGPRLPI